MMLIKENKIKKIYLLVLAFTSGLAIMAVEISASRLIAPYFGTSTFIWTNVIGVIMVALSIGYYVGGKLADKKSELKILLKIIILACLILAIIPFLAKPLAETAMHWLLVFSSSAAILFFGSLLTISLLFILPIVLLGITSPFIIKLLSMHNDRIGNDAGLVFCVSTLGSIVGTFLPVLIFIPYLGTRQTIIFFSLLLLLIASWGLLQPKNKWLVLFFVLIIPVCWLKLPQLKSAQGAIYEGESAYQYMQVVDENNFRLLKINEGLGLFSMLNNEAGNFLTNNYWDFYNLLPYLDGQAQNQDILILGLAGGTISTQLNHFFGADHNLQIDGVEIDPKIIDLARQYFNLDNQSLKVFNQDGRSFLDLTDKKYNAVIIDVYANQLYISFHLTTREFFVNVKNHLQKKGIVAMNVNAVSRDSALLKNITDTMLLVFSHVYLVPIGDNGWNYMVLAADQEIDFSQLNVRPELADIAAQAQKNEIEISYDNNFGYLTDDKAPIEHLTDWMVLDYMFNK